MQTEEQKEKGMIITDDFAANPVLDFNAYADTIVEIIKSSEPNFTVGIYGEWGTGKTTLMRKIESQLNSEKSITTVWFNAWRYEREEQFTLIPLLKKIAYSLPTAEKFDGLRDSIKKGAGTIRRNLGQIVTSVVSDFVSKSVGTNTAEVIKDISNQLIPKIELLTEVNEKDTIYFDGLDKIEEEVKKIRVKGHPVRIVVFIDDLDRCSPKKALEVFESVKVFLGVAGFIYVLGLSHETISKLITAEYGKSEIKGDQYIKKIIQIPITLPEWNPEDVSKLIQNFIDTGLIIDKYVDIIKDNKDLIAKAIENNPRETKRFINNFIVAHEILLRYVQKVNAKEFLLVQAINVRWNRFYRVIVKLDERSRHELKLYVEMSEEKRNKELDADAPPTPEPGEVQVVVSAFPGTISFSMNLKRLLREFKIDLELWAFLKEHSEAIFGIKNWEIYRRGAESVSEIPPDREQDYFEIMNRTERLLSAARFEAPPGFNSESFNDIISSRIRKLYTVISTSQSQRKELETIGSIIEGLRKLREELIVSGERLPEMDKTATERLSHLISGIDKILEEWKELEPSSQE